MKNKEKELWIVFLAIFAILLIYLSQGLIFSKSKDRETKQNQLDDLKDELSKVNGEIRNLEPQKERLELRERKLFLGVRISVGCLLVVGNFICWWLFDKRSFNLGNQLNYNYAALLLYSFSAYILYGSMGNFTKSMKTSSINYLRKNNIHIWEEIKCLKERKTNLEDEISKRQKQNPWLKIQ